jgi:ABC-2 type transport system permease protein
MSFNGHAVLAIYKFEVHRFMRTLMTSLATPMITTSLYFIVFGSAIGSRMTDIDGVAYGSFIVPGLILLAVFNESIFNASFGIYMPKWAGTIYELLSAPVSPLETVLGYVGAATTKSLAIGFVILATANLFVDVEVAYPLWMVATLVLVSTTFCMFGFIIGIWAKSFEQLQVIPLLIVMPLTFLGGAFYSLDVLPPTWQTITLFNPIVYLISGFRWTFFGKGDVAVEVSFGATVGFFALCAAIIAWMLKTGYRLKT